IGISFLTGIIVGLVPGWQAARIDIDRTLKEGWRLSSDSTRFSRIRSMLVIIEVALALTLLIGSGLLIGSFSRVIRVESGLNASNVLTASISLPKATYPPVRTRQFFSDLISRMRAYPSVKSVGATNILPMGKGDTVAYLFEIIGRPKAGKFDEMFANHRVVTPDYFSSLGIPLVEGRYFTEQDEENTKQVVIITESLAKRFWPNERPIGKQIQSVIKKDTPVEIVGVVKDVKHLGLESNINHEIYFPYRQSFTRLTALVIKSDSGPLKYATAVQKEVQALGQTLPVYDIKTMEQRIDESTGHRRFITFLLGIFAVIAVLLAGIGIHSVVSYSTSQRTSEIGIRMALGAERRQILTLIIGKIMMLVSMGAIIGIVVAAMLTRVMAGILYGLIPMDFPTYIITTIVMLVIAMMAAFFPAYKATKVDPLVALRCE
ncbi:MAG TPA: ABC transporter permease, partial [Blastocatellia bacterium]|nr:ABC transporter permease [Blastocatellia bacterium]